MARFNAPATVPNKTTNREGAVAYSLTAEMELYSLVCTANLQDKFYEGKDETVARLRTLLPKVDPKFAWNLALYAREKMNLRSVPLVVAVELCKLGHGDANKIARIISRADELTEILAYFALANGRDLTKQTDSLAPAPYQLRKGVAKAFGKFDEYAFGKYDRDGAIKLRDALFFTRPNPTRETPKKPEHDITAYRERRAALYKKIADGTLETPYTWETRLSEAGKTGEGKKAVWEEMIEHWVAVS